MRVMPILPAVALCAGLLVACGGDDGDGAVTTTTSATTTTTTPAPTTTVATTTTAATTTTVATTTTRPDGGVTLEQPAIWPAAGVVFTTPEAAARDFVERSLGVPAVLGPFMQGDSRSGEIEIGVMGDGAPLTDAVRGVLFLRQLGPASSWFVIGVGNDSATITAPEAGATVPAGPITVQGKGRGFEALVVVRAFPAGSTEAFDEVITSGGSMETPEPYSVTVDLSGAAPGSTVMLVVRGGVGLETDPGDTGAIPVVIAG